MRSLWRRGEKKRTATICCTTGNQSTGSNFQTTFTWSSSRCRQCRALSVCLIQTSMGRRISYRPWQSRWVRWLLWWNTTNPMKNHYCIKPCPKSIPKFIDASWSNWGNRDPSVRTQTNSPNGSNYPSTIFKRKLRWLAPQAFDIFYETLNSIPKAFQTPWTATRNPLRSLQAVRTNDVCYNNYTNVRRQRSLQNPLSSRM